MASKAIPSLVWMDSAEDVRKSAMKYRASAQASDIRLLQWLELVFGSGNDIRCSFRQINEGAGMIQGKSPEETDPEKVGALRYGPPFSEGTERNEPLLKCVLSPTSSKRPSLAAHHECTCHQAQDSYRQERCVRR